MSRITVTFTVKQAAAAHAGLTFLARTLRGASARDAKAAAQVIDRAIYGRTIPRDWRPYRRRPYRPT